MFLFFMISFVLMIFLNMPLHLSWDSLAKDGYRPWASRRSRSSLGSPASKPWGGESVK
ncbi:hypothetical protein BDV98DRAFT_640618 [Pterulicium gracile]|uniref:Uncharacterized protein n=1 Tax=Pterulicium gracile TaxID=1884261 RepID=A0A5C3Q182_9AGAR|nr:hypothetical protein BDV98DRAFT_640618 [Pterula gracilis]